MNKLVIILPVWFYFILALAQLQAQVVRADFLVNDASQNINGVGRTSIATAPNGTYGVAWQDFNDYNIPVTEIPRVATQMFAANGSPIGPTNLFRGESRPLAIWISDFLTGDIDLDFLPDGTMLVCVEHRGELSIGGTTVPSAETGIGGVSSSGQIIDLSTENGVIRWLVAVDWDDAENMRIDVSPTGEFAIVLNGPTFSTGFSAVGIQQFDANGNFVGNMFVPHTGDPGPNSNHVNPDYATNGAIHLVTWQDGSQDNNYDITAQFYTNTGPLGGNQRVNVGDPGGTLNVVPSMAMNASGNSVVVWADFRQGGGGEIYGQRYNASGQTVGGNFQISAGQGEIWDRPEVAIRNDGSFMVVWTDSMSGAVGLDALRARARQYDAAGNPTAAPSLVPNLDIPSGLVNIASDGTLYYCAWLDTRFDNQTPNVYAKIIGDIVISIDPLAGTNIPLQHALLQNYPNPFNPETRIRYQISDIRYQNADFRLMNLAVFDVQGRKVRTLVNKIQPPGSYSVSWDGRDDAGLPLASGVYFYELRTGDFRQTRKMMLVR